MHSGANTLQRAKKCVEIENPSKREEAYEIHRYLYDIHVYVRNEYYFCPKIQQQMTRKSSEKSKTALETDAERKRR